MQGNLDVIVCYTALKLVWQELDLFYVAQQEELIIKSYIQDTTFIGTQIKETQYLMSHLCKILVDDIVPNHPQVRSNVDK